MSDNYIAYENRNIMNTLKNLAKGLKMNAMIIKPDQIKILFEAYEDKEQLCVKHFGLVEKIEQKKLDDRSCMFPEQSLGMPFFLDDEVMFGTCIVFDEKDHYPDENELKARVKFSPRDNYLYGLLNNHFQDMTFDLQLDTKTVMSLSDFLKFIAISEDAVKEIFIGIVEDAIMDEINVKDIFELAASQVYGLGKFS
jgi:hypothetical protein